MTKAHRRHVSRRKLPTLQPADMGSLELARLTIDHSCKASSLEFGDGSQGAKTAGHEAPRCLRCASLVYNFPSFPFCFPRF